METERDEELETFMQKRTGWSECDKDDMRKATKEVKRLGLENWFRTVDLPEGKDYVYWGNNLFSRCSEGTYNADSGMTRAIMCRALQYYYKNKDNRWDTFVIRKKTCTLPQELCFLFGE